MKKLLIPIDTVAESFGVCRSTIYNIARRGELQLIKVGARSAVTTESVEAFIERQKAKPVYGTAKRAV